MIDQARNKYKNIRGIYTKAVDNNGETGAAPDRLKYFDEMDRVYGTKPSTRPHYLIDSHKDPKVVIDGEKNSGECKGEKGSSQV